VSAAWETIEKRHGRGSVVRAQESRGRNGLFLTEELHSLVWINQIRSQREESIVQGMEFSLVCQ
jgi:hypothetical protein